MKQLISETNLRIAFIFLLGSGQSFIGEDKAEEDSKSDVIVRRLGLSSDLVATK